MHPELISSGGDRALLQNGDPEWVADLFDTLHDGDRDTSLSGLELLLRTMRDAAPARSVLAGLRPGLICQGLEVRATRRVSEL